MLLVKNRGLNYAILVVYLAGAESEVHASGECHVCEESWGLYSILCCSQFQTQQVAIHNLA